MDWVDKSMRLLIISFVYLTRDISHCQLFLCPKIMFWSSCRKQREDRQEIEESHL